MEIERHWETLQNIQWHEICWGLTMIPYLLTDRTDYRDAIASKNTKRILPTWLWTHFSLPGTNAAIHDSCQNHAKNSFICVVFVDFANKSIFFALVLPFIRRNPLYTGKLWPSFLALFFMGYLDGIPAVLSDKPNRDPSPHPKNDARNQLKKVLLTPKMRHGTKSSRQLWPTFCNYSEEWSRPFLVCP